MNSASKKAILVVSFGTSYENTRKVTIDAIERDIADAFPACPTYRAWTSKMIISKLKKRDGIIINTVKEAMEQMIADGELLEYAQYVDNYYGTPKAYVEKQLADGKDVILEIEIQGALKVKKQFPQTLLLFVTPPSAEILKERLIGRGTEDMEIINKRLSRACEEAEGIENYDYLVINDDLDICVEEVHQMIRNEHLTIARNEKAITQMREELKGFLKGE